MTDRASTSWRAAPGGGGRACPTGAPFIANDCALDPEGDGAAITLLTGPNMAGKSTWLRQNA
jgi:DNA mismatch repair ATPase MutS